jgi:hypothetical protein
MNRRGRHEEELRAIERDEQEMTPGARRRIRVLEERWRRLVKTLIVVFVLGAIGFMVTGWQINQAFDSQEEERISRIGGQSSINAYFCRKIDQVGDGVAALVAVSLQEAPSRDTLTRGQREGFDKFQEYLDRQRRPPRCRAVALQLAILTGADPADVQITPLKIEPKIPPPAG